VIQRIKGPEREREREIPGWSGDRGHLRILAHSMFSVTFHCVNPLCSNSFKKKKNSAHTSARRAE
jgi:hypothetical protein